MPFLRFGFEQIPVRIRCIAIRLIAFRGSMINSQNFDHQGIIFHATGEKQKEYAFSHGEGVCFNTLFNP